jgi:hypothetical protein
MHHIFFIYSFFEERLDWLYILDVVNNAAVTVRSGIARPYLSSSLVLYAGPLRQRRNSVLMKFSSAAIWEGL